MRFLTRRAVRTALAIAIAPFIVPAAFADMTAQQHWERGNTENGNAQYTEAIADYDAAIQMKSDFWKAYANRGIARFNLKQYQPALGDINLALEHLSPNATLSEVKGRIEQAMQGDQAMRANLARQAYFNSLNGVNMGIGTPAGSIMQLGSIAQRARQIQQTDHRFNTVAASGSTPDSPFTASSGSDTKPFAASTTTASELPSSGGPIHTAHGAGAAHAGSSSPHSSAPSSHSTSSGGSRSSGDSPFGGSASSPFTATSGPEKSPAIASAKLPESSSSASITTSSTAPSSQVSTQQLIERGTEKGKSGDWNGAIADFSACIEQDPKNAVAYANRGAAKLQTGDLQGAVDDMDKACDLVPNNPQAQQLRAQLKAAVEQARKEGHLK